VLVVDAKGSAADFGDEPLLIARKLGAPVVVGESRYAAGLKTEERFDSQLHILDDGFQHRSLARDFDIVLVSGQDFEDRLLPSGRLREPLSALERADAVVLPAGFTMAREDLRGKLVWRMKRQIEVPTAPEKPVVFCGIARPEQFFAHVRAVGITPAAELDFRDHQTYGRREIEELRATRAKLGAGGFVTTEKDAVNLGRLLEELDPVAIATLRVTLDGAADIVDTILERIGEEGTRS
jgi:tetraacyldisaccharide 4'-kinase